MAEDIVISEKDLTAAVTKALDTFEDSPSTLHIQSGFDRCVTLIVHCIKVANAKPSEALLNRSKIISLPKGD